MLELILKTCPSVGKTTCFVMQSGVMLGGGAILSAMNGITVCFLPLKLITYFLNCLLTCFSGQ